MGCCGSIIKYLLFIFNFIFVLCGIALIAAGSFMIADSVAFSELADRVDVVIKAPAIVLIVLGVLIFIISFLGCCGAIRESKCMLIAFAVCLGIVFIIQLVIGIYALVALSDDNIESTLTKIFKERSTESIKMFESLENSFECCGVQGMSNYPEYGFPISTTCCQTQTCTEPPVYWPSGCASKFGAWLNNTGKYLGGVAVGLSIVELFGIALALIKTSTGLNSRLFKYDTSAST